MGEIKGHPPVKLIVGMFTAQPELFDVAEERLNAKFGLIDYESEALPFDTTTWGDMLLAKLRRSEEPLNPGIAKRQPCSQKRKPLLD